jgi:hypothetical protein
VTIDGVKIVQDTINMNSIEDKTGDCSPNPSRPLSPNRFDGLKINCKFYFPPYLGSFQHMGKKQLLMMKVVILTGEH